MKTYISTIWILFIFLLSSCKKAGFYEGDHFFIKNKGAEMPVTVKGNIESKKFVLFLHGGLRRPRLSVQGN